MINLRECIGLGIAGNFANHLEQAGEISDFVNVTVKEEHAPKGLFPFYLPNFENFLGTYPLDETRLILPKESVNVHMEPELAILFKINYEGTLVSYITPLKFGAFNDSTIRKEGAAKISEKKNWGYASKGLSPNLIELDKFENGGILDSYRIASFLRRSEQFEEYGVDSPVLGYNYFYEKLQRWIVAKLNSQEDINPLENINEYLNTLHRPEFALISIGATSYTEFGEKNFLKANDKVYVCIYDSKQYSQKDIEEFAKADVRESKEGLSMLSQEVI